MATSDNDWYNNLMLFLSMFGWWYSTGWWWVISNAKTRLINVQRMFSVSILLRTLFAPWKQIVGMPNRNQSLDAKFRMKLDNLISRLVGFVVRTLTLLAALVSFVFVLMIEIIFILLWPLLPLSIIISILFFVGVL